MLRQLNDKAEPRDTFVRARVTSAEKKEVVTRCTELGISEADYIRYCINKEMNVSINK